MRLNVLFRDAGHRFNAQPVPFTPYRFLKHFSLAAHGHAPSLGTRARMLGAFLWNADYLHPGAFAASRFSQPLGPWRDPTAKGQFSNLVGKAFADALTRSFNGALITYNYEGWCEHIGIQVVGPRPDLICLTPSSFGALEAKGYTQRSVSDAQMSAHKTQSLNGPFPVQFSAASVSFDLYAGARCYFYDPVDPESRFDPGAGLMLTKLYYRGLADWARRFMDQVVFEFRNRRYLLLDIPLAGFGAGEAPPNLLTSHPAALVLDARVYEWAERGRVEFDDPTIDESTFFLDRDGIGVIPLDWIEKRSRWPRG